MILVQMEILIVKCSTVNWQKLMKNYVDDDHDDEEEEDGGEDGFDDGWWWW